MYRNTVSVHFEFGRSVATNNKVYSRFQNGWPNWQIAEWPNDVTSLLALLLAITSHLLSSIAICYDVMPFAIELLDNHSEINSEINCTTIYKFV